jgi:hypothetical protein
VKDDHTIQSATKGLMLLNQFFKQKSITLPQFINPKYYIDNIDNFIKGQGLVMVLCALSILGGFRKSAFILIVNVVMFNLLVHNPFLFTDPEEHKF